MMRIIRIVSYITINSIRIVIYPIFMTIFLLIPQYYRSNLCGWYNVVT